MNRLALILLGLTIVLGTACAQQSAWRADPVHSRVEFRVSHMVIAEVTGRFTAFDVKLTQQGMEPSAISAAITAKSVDTDNEARDKHLRSDAFLNAEKDSVLTFTSTSIKKTGQDTYDVTGDLTIRGTSKPVVLKATYNGSIVDPRGSTREGFKATTSINRFDYGVSWDKTLDAGGLVVGKEVDITLLMEFVKQ